MPAFKILLCVILLSFACLIINPALGQTPQYTAVVGLPNGNAAIPVESGSIDPATGNLHLSIPLPAYAQRGSSQPISLVFNYDSHFYTTFSFLAGEETTEIVPVLGQRGGTPPTSGNGGWTLFSSVTEGVNHSVKTNTNCPVSSGNTGLEYYNWTFEDSNGTYHSFPSVTTVGSCEPSASGYAGDGSGYFISVTNNTDAQVFGPDGSHICCSTGSFENKLFEDSNGNFVGEGTTGPVVDELGRQLFNETDKTDSNNNLREVDITVPTSNGTTATYIASYSQIPVHTNFYPGNFTNWVDFSGTLTVLTTLTLPSGQSYVFNYDQGSDPGHYGTLQSMTLPTGATINYTYQITQAQLATTGNSTIDLRLGSKSTYGSTGALQFAYQRDNLDRPVQTTVTSPVGDDTVYTFNIASSSESPSTVQVFHGSGSGRSSVQLTQWTNPGIAPTQQTVTLSNGSVATTTYAGDPNASNSANVGNSLPAPRLLQEKDSGFSGSLLRETDYTYLTTTPYLSAHMVNKPLSVIVYDGGHNRIAETDYSYDGGSLTSVSGATAHDDSAYGTTNNVRGNLTSIRRWAGGSSFATTTQAYNTLGEIVSVTDPNSHATMYGYSDRWNGSDCVSGSTYAFPTSQINSLGQETDTSYDSCTGDVYSVKDPNDISAGRAGTVYAYDNMRRLTTTSDPAGGGQSVDYGGSSLPQIITTTTMAAPSPNEVSSTTLDGLGRVSHSSLTNGAIIDTNYDPMGRESSVSNPHLGTPSSTDGTTTYAYDALGRMMTKTNQDSSTQQWNYSGNTVTFTDEAGHPWKRTTDALGRLTQVLEPDSNNSPTIETDYQYDALGNLTRVDQWGGPQGNSGDRVRTFTYDSLSRLSASSNPETGPISYIYDTNGNLTSKTDGRGITTSYVYDALNRMTNKTSAGANGVPGFNYLYGYDSVSPPTPNRIGRLLFTATDPGVAAGVAEEYIYDSMGRMTTKTTALPSAPKSPVSMSATYDLAGNLTSLTYPDGRTISQQWNGAGEVTQIVDGSGYQYLTNQSVYWPNGSPSQIFHGNSEADGYHLNSRLQIDEIGHVHIGSSGVNSNESLSVKEYCYGPATAALSSTIPGCPQLSNGKNNGNIWLIMDTLNNTNSQGFTYDNLNRISQFANGDQSMKQGFGIDAWGNMTAGGTSTFSVSYGGNNRILGSGVVYDAAGNVTTFNNGAMTNSYGYDAEGKFINVNNGGATYTYDADGNRARKDSAGSFTEYVQFNGQTMAEKNGDGTWSDYIFADGKRIARADNYDIRIHMSGINCSGCGSTNTFAGTQSLTALNGTVIRSGDLLTWRQFQDGVASGGISVAFNNNTSGTNGVLRDTDGQLTDADTTLNTWHFRAADLTSYAGNTVSNLNLYNFQGGAPGNWDIYVGDVSLVRTDGTSIPIYSRSTEGLVQFPAGAAESNVTVVTEKLLETDGTSTTTFFHSNQLGSTELITASTGWPIASDIYYPYGSGPMVGNDHYLFTGKERDTESGLDYFGARYYASNMGRFMSPDWSEGPDSIPYADLSNPQSLNLYSYASNSPVVYSDPDGHLWGCRDQTTVDIGSGVQVNANCSDSTFAIFSASDFGSYALSLIHNVAATISSSTSNMNDPNNVPSNSFSTIRRIYNSGCAGSALRGNAASLSLDVLGVGLAASPLGPEAKILGAIALGVTSTVVGATDANSATAKGRLATLGAVSNIFGIQTAPLELAQEFAQFSKGAGKVLTGVGVGADLATVGVDIKTCLSQQR